jgi:hypothetical protein
MSHIATEPNTKADPAISPGWTKETIIETLRDRLPQDGTACLDPNGDCVLQNIDGYACAVGAFIPDNLYCPTLEQATMHELMELMPDGAPLNWEGMIKLQNTHDISLHNARKNCIEYINSLPDNG